MRRLAVLVLLCACGGRAEEHRRATAQARAGEAFEGSLSPRPTPEAFAVAEVNGDTIWDVDVARYAGEHGLDARTALAELIDLTLLAQEAHRRGLDEDPEVVEARQQARVRAFIARDFAAGFTGPEDVPEADLQAAWRRRDIYLFFNHELYHRVRYARIPVKKTADDATRQAARVRAEDLRRTLVAARPTSKEAFADAITAWKTAHPGHKVEMGDFPASQGDETAKRFRTLAFSISKPGEISAVGETAWGWDIIYLDEVLEKTAHTLEQASPALRQRLFESSQKSGFLRWVSGLAAGHAIVRHDELLEAVTVESIPGAAGAP